MDTEHGRAGVLTLRAGMGNATNTGTMAQELKGQPGLQGELDTSLGYTDLTFRKSRGQLWAGKMDQGQRHFCQAFLN